MKTVDQMIEQYGKKGAMERMVHSEKNGSTGADDERISRWGKGEVLMRICPHNKVVLRDGKEIPDACGQCRRSTPISKARDYRPNFNIGLGCWVESRSEEKKIAKSLGLREAG